MEDRSNTAMLEAMGARLPILANRHPTSPIRGGIDGILSHDPMEWRAHAWQLVGNELARKMRAEGK